MPKVWPSGKKKRKERKASKQVNGKPRTNRVFSNCQRVCYFGGLISEGKKWVKLEKKLNVDSAEETGTWEIVTHSTGKGQWQFLLNCKELF